MTAGVVHLTARWNGLCPPRAGQWLMAPAGRTAYEITAVRRRRLTSRRGYNFVLTCVRHLPSDVPARATVHVWTWDKRQRRRS